MAPRISYVPVESMDERMQDEMHRCAREGAPRPESSAVRAHAPNAFWAFADSWQAIFRTGVLDHPIEELARVYVSRTVECEFCGNQRSIQATTAGLLEQQYDDLLNLESSDRYDDRQKAALAYTEAICWRLDIEHHQVLAGTGASMAPGFETAAALARSTSAETYWANGSPEQPASSTA